MRTIAILAARLIFAAVFLMAASFKFAGMAETAGYIATAGFPFALPLAWIAALFEVALVLAFLTGAYFSEAALLAGAYVIFLAFSFHGPSHWEGTRANSASSSTISPSWRVFCSRRCTGRARCWRCTGVFSKGLACRRRQLA
jgi:uncharacterized membrane protein YphA (DoxX/SURF4 family)